MARALLISVSWLRSHCRDGDRIGQQRRRAAQRRGRLTHLRPGGGEESTDHRRTDSSTALTARMSCAAAMPATTGTARPKPKINPANRATSVQDEDAQHARRHERHPDQEETVDGVAVARADGQAHREAQPPGRVTEDGAHQSAPDGRHDARDGRGSDDVRRPRGNAFRDHQYRLSFTYKIKPAATIPIRSPTTIPAVGTPAIAPNRQPNSNGMVTARAKYTPRPSISALLTPAPGGRGSCVGVDTAAQSASPPRRWIRAGTLRRPLINSEASASNAGSGGASGRCDRRRLRHTSATRATTSSARATSRMRR